MLCLRVFHAAAIALPLLVAAPSAVALAPSSPGSVDPTFGANGVQALSIRSGYESASAIVATPEGKWLVSGSAQSAGQEDGVRYLMRLHADGRIDSSFGAQGFIFDNYYARVLAVQSTGKIIAATETETGGITKAVLHRLLPDGSRDFTFGVSGGETVIGTGSAVLNYQDFEHLEIDAQGRIVAVSALSNDDSSSSKAEVWRFSVDGIPDAAFGNQGRSSLEDIAPVVNNPIVRVQPDGKIVVAMWCQQTKTAKVSACIARIDANGIRDASFGPNGVRQYTAPSGTQYLVYDMQIAPNGKIYMIATDINASPAKGIVFGLNADGTPDQGYGAGGMAMLTSVLDTTYVLSLRLLPDGRQLLGGFSTDRHGDSYGFVARMTPDGHPDPAFGVGGISSRVLAETNAFRDFAVLADGSLLAIGNRYNTKSNNNDDVDVILVRYVGVEITTPVVEFYNGLLDHYFITADPNEATAIDNGAAGPGWARTGQTFKSGGPNRVCRFYGSPDINPATGTRRGPNSHFCGIL